jgi:hypothetical protein
VGTGTLQNICSDIAINRDGSRFVVGLWGDEGNVCPEVRLYKRNQSTPAALYNLPGSVFDVDISGDGERVAAASKAVHANLYDSGGSISYYAFEPQDLRVTGVPTPGSTVHVDLTGPANSNAYLLYAPVEAANPMTFGGGIGTLWLQRWTTSVVQIAPTNASGHTSVDYPLPGGTTAIGQTRFFQGYFASPRKLTSDWARVTILP